MVRLSAILKRISQATTLSLGVLIIFHSSAEASPKKRSTIIPIVTVADSASTSVNQFIAFEVLRNDANVSPSAKISSVSRPRHGKAKVIGGVLVGYTPKAAFVGVDHFTYKVKQNGKKYLGQISVSVSPAEENISFSRTSLVAAAPLVGDLNNDCVVNGSDLTVIGQHWGQKLSRKNPGPLEGDANADGQVNAQDIALVASHYGNTCGLPSTPTPTPTPTTPTPTPTASATPINTPTPTPTISPSATPSATPTATPRPTATQTATATPTATFTPTPTPTFTDQIVNVASPIILNTSGQTYTLTTSLRFSGTGIYIAASNVTLNLNGHTIYYGSNNAAFAHGVVLYNNWDSSQPSVSIPNASSPDRAKILNGSIVHEGSGANADAIYSVQASGTNINGVRVRVNGRDSASIRHPYGTLTVTNCVLNDQTTDTSNRFAGPANVWSEHATVNAFGNVLIGGNAGFNVGDNSQITENVISQANFATNGYALFNFGSSNILFADNIVLPIGPHGGPGVIINGAYNDIATDNIIQNNVLLHSDSPNEEYPGGLNAAALRVRYTTNGNIFRGNTGLGLAGGAFTGASGLSLSNDGSAGINTFTNNSFTVILKGTPNADAYYASALSPCGQGSGDPANPSTAGRDEPSNDIIKGNIFRSNHLLIRMDNNLGGPGVQLAPAVGNSFSWVDGNTARTDFMAAVRAKLVVIGMSSNADALNIVSGADALIASQTVGVPLQAERYTWFLKYWSDPATAPGTPIFISLLDSIWGSGVSPTSFTYRSGWPGTVAARIGLTLHAKLVNASNVAIANKAVLVTTNAGDSYSLATDASGNIDIPIIQTGMDKAAAASAAITVNSRSSTTIAVNGYSGLTFSQSTLLGYQANGGVTTLVVQ